MFRFDRRLLLNFDLVLLLTVLLIAACGLLNLYSATYATAAGTSLFFKQLYFYLMGFILLLLIISFDYRLLISWNYFFYGATIFLLLYALLFGREISGSQRWINLGFFYLQPSEPAKLILVLTLASYYYRKDTGKGFSLRELGVPMLLTGLPFLLILKQPDLGTSL
ncbi:MAG: FtsW/RodA/SpoVE family cell cycle protein, partial [Deltaproteobacteria bacterium]